MHVLVDNLSTILDRGRFSSSQAATIWIDVLENNLEVEDGS